MLRHAKAASESPDGTDHSRPLTRRGRAQAEQARRFLERRHSQGSPVPHLVISSSATRAVETAEAVLPALGTDVVFEIERDLYDADADEVVDRLRRVEEGSDSVMVVGHNPTFADLVQLLLSESDVAGKRRVESFPTCALAEVVLPVAKWSDLHPGAGTLEDLFVPEVPKES